MPYDCLPPLGAIGENDHAVVVSYLQGLAREARVERDQWDSIIDENRMVYTYGKVTIPDDDELIVPEIQNAVIAITDIQTKEPPTATLEPVETGEPATYYWAGPMWIGQALSQLIAAPLIDPVSGVAFQRVGFPTIGPQHLGPTLTHPDDAMVQDLDPTFQPPMRPPQPLDPLLGEHLLTAAEMQMPLPLPPLVPGIPITLKEEWIVAVNDELVSNTYQTVLDVKWAHASLDRRIRSNLLTTNIDGTTFWLYEWDDEKQLPCLRPMSFKQVYIDPTVEDIADAQYAEVYLWLDAEEAKAMYPHLAAAIDEHAERGQPELPAEAVWGQAFDRTFERPGVTMVVAFLRNQPVPLDLAEAVNRQLVEVRGVPVGAEGNEPPADEAQEQTQGETHDGAQSDGGIGEGVDPGEPGVAEQSGAPVGGVAEASVIPTRPAYFLPGGTDEITPTYQRDGRTTTHPQWPVRRVIRQLTYVANAVVDDRENEHWDIPILHNVNIPIPGKPFGMGEPFRLKTIQAAESDALQSMVKNMRAFRSPVAWVTESTFERLPEECKSAMAVPTDRLLVVPDQLARDLQGKPIGIQAPPELPQSAVQVHGILKDTVTEGSGHSEVLQGRASAQLSGRAIETLQTSAASMIGFKSQRTGDLVYRLAHLINHNVTTRMTADDVGKIVSKYEPHVMAAIHERAQRMDWDVKVTVSSGNGAIKTQKMMNAREDLKTGALDMESYRDLAGYDNRIVERRQQAQMQRQAALAAQMAPPPAAGAGPSNNGADKKPTQGAPQ